MDFLPFANRKATLLTAGAVVAGVAFLFSGGEGPLAGLEHLRTVDSAASDGAVEHAGAQIHLVREDELMVGEATSTETLSPGDTVQETSFASDEELIDLAEGFDPSPMEPQSLTAVQAGAEMDASVID